MSKSTFISVLPNLNVQNVNLRKGKNDENMSMRRAILLSLKLILRDLFWGIVATAVGIMIVLLIQTIPTRKQCNLLKKESKSEENFRLPYSTFFIEIFWTFTYYTIPLGVFIMLVEHLKPENGHSLWNFLAQLYKKWRKAIILSVFFAFLELSYKIFGIFIYTLGKEPKKFPWWFSIPTDINWIIASIVVLNVAARLWADKIFYYLTNNCGIRQSVLQQDTGKVYKSLRNSMLLSTILPTAISSIVSALLNIFHVSKESHRTILIISTTALCYPLWLVLDNKGKSPVPWSHQVKEFIDSPENKYDEFINPQEKIDPITQNGFVLSGFIFTGTFIAIRIFQANMETLTSKIAMGVLASSLESVFVVIKPHLKKYMNKIVGSVKKVVSFRIVPSNNAEDDDAQKKREESVYRWHRAHTIVYVNRLEMFSVIFSHLLMMVSIRAKNKAMESVVNFNSECGSPTSVTNFLLSMIVLCSLEILIESCTYVYLFRVEKLQLMETSIRFQFKFCFVYFSIMTVMYFVNIFLSIAYSIQSCDGLDEAFYIYYCF